MSGARGGLSKQPRAEQVSLTAWPLSVWLAWAASQLSGQNGWTSWMAVDQAETAKLLMILLLKTCCIISTMFVGQNSYRSAEIQGGQALCLNGERT